MTQRFKDHQTSSQQQREIETEQNTEKIVPVQSNEISDDKPLLQQFMSRLNAITESTAPNKIKKHTALFL